MAILSGTASAEPGQEVTLSYDIAGTPEEDAVVWIDHGGDRPVFLPLLLPSRSASSANTTNLMVPPLPAGEYSLSLGTPADGPLSNTVTLRVRAGASRYSQAEAARVISDGLRTLSAAVATQFEGAALRPLFEEGLGAENLTSIGEFLRDLERVAAQIEADYLALDAATEVQYQAFMRNQDLMALFEQARVPAEPGAAAASLAGFVQLDHSHLPQLLFAGLDVAEAALTGASAVTDVVTMVALLISGPGAAVPFQIGVFIDILRGVLNVAVPTEFVSVSPHHESRVVECEPFRQVWWARLRPQQTIAEAATSVTFGVALRAKSKAMEKAFENAGSAIADRVSQALADILFTSIIEGGKQLTLLATDSTTEYLWQAQAVVNTGLYDITLADLLALAHVATGVPPMLVKPGLQAALKATGLGDPSVVASVWSDGPQGFAVSHALDEYRFYNVPGTPGTAVRTSVSARFFSFDGLELFLVTVPKPVPTKVYAHDIDVVPLGMACPQQMIVRDQVMVHTRLGEAPVADVVVPLLEERYPRTVKINLWNALSCLSTNPQVRILINGTEARPFAPVSGSTAFPERFAFKVEPGYNRITVEGVGECLPDGQEPTRVVWLRAEFPDALGPDRTFEIESFEPVPVPGLAAVFAEIEVWAPPTVPSNG